MSKASEIIDKAIHRLFGTTQEVYTINGLDISFWETMIRGADGRTLIYVADFGKVRLDTTIRFFIWKATQGMFPDPSFYRTEADTRNWVPRTTYHFFEGDKDGNSQALYHLGTTSYFVTNLPDIVDVEHYGGASAVYVARRLEAYIRTIHDQTGRFPMIYTAKWFWDTLPAVEGADQCLLFVANYTTANLPVLPLRPWTNFTFWQWETVTKVNGLVGGVDHDRFHGTELDFARLVSNVPPPQTLPRQAIVLVASLWVRSSPDGIGIGGLTRGNIVTVYELRETYSGSWARISPDGASERWACMKTSAGIELMKFI